MNEEKINQILKNQMIILRFMNTNNFNNPYYDGCESRIKETVDLLYPPQETPLQEQIEDAMSEQDAKQGGTE
jgi:hypothetical protein